MEDVQSIWQYLHGRVEKQDIDELQMRMCVMTLRDHLKHFISVKALHFVDEQILVLEHFLPLKTSQTGKHMESFWEALKPLTSPTRQSFEDLITLETLADRFDALQWDLEVPPSQLVQIRKSFANAMRLVKEGHPETDNQALIDGLGDVLTGMTKVDQDSSTAIRPFFHSEFEQICRQFYLHLSGRDVNFEQLGNLYLNAAVFAEIPTKSLVMENATTSRGTEQYRILQYLSGYVGDHELSQDSLESKASLDGYIANKL